ncbi:hypothetical protein NXX53_06535 [Bacteroides salyersiae]|uniref:hypothetical protein n=1 Tax=uncultured Bacteroides sp. TaxID=162156 RepID=UPI0025DB158D|nr:hypothetical protein [uncultured Bacteroides sp.]MCS2956933.1 hypothetical protein [Bacteroides salyersiae]
MEHTANPYNLFAIKPGNRFKSSYFNGIASVVSISDGIATMQFEDSTESHRNGETWTIASIEEEIRILDLYRLTSFQCKRNKPDGSFTRGFGFWEDMADRHSWHFVVQFLPNYERRDDVMTSDDLSSTITGEKTLEWFYENYPQWDGLSINELKTVYYQWDYELEKEAEAYLFAAIQSGEIEVREIPVIISSARIMGNDETDGVWLQCADHTLTSFGKEFTLPASQLQNVWGRWIEEDTPKEQFQILYIAENNSGDTYWCNAQSIDFNFPKQTTP